MSTCIIYTMSIGSPFLILFNIIFKTLYGYGLGGFGGPSGSLVLLAAVTVPSLVLSSSQRYIPNIFYLLYVVWPSLPSLLLLHLENKDSCGVYGIRTGYMGLGRGIWD